MSRTLKYIGPHVDGVEVTLPNGLTVHVKRMGHFESDFPELSESLLEQKDNWEAVPQQRASASNDDKKKE